MTRPTLDETLLATARLWSLRSTCTRARVGAVLARDGHPVAIGYNGAPAGLPHCPEHADDEPCDVAVHAERNAINDAARRGVTVDGCTLYCTLAPCRACAGDLVNAGVRRVFYLGTYRSAAGVELLVAAGVHCAHVV